MQDGGLFTSALANVIYRWQFSSATWADVFEETRSVAGMSFEMSNTSKAMKGIESDVPQRTQTAWSFETMYGKNPNTARLGATPCIDCGKHIMQVLPGSPAKRIGLEPGDMILAVNDMPVKNAEHLAQLVNNSSARIKLLVRNVRNGDHLSMKVKLPY